MRTTLSLTILWGLSVVAILAQLPHPHPWLVWGSLGYVGYYLGASAWLQRRARAAR